VDWKAHRRVSGGLFVALAMIFSIPVAADAASSSTHAVTGSSATTASASPGKSDTSSLSPMSSVVPKPEANSFTNVDGRRYAVPAPTSSAAISGTASVTVHAQVSPQVTASGPTLYVNSAKTAACSDTASGAGTQTVPFCTLQAAADTVVPGDTVLVAPGVYRPFTITVHGTAADPITFESSATVNIATNPGGVYSIYIEPASAAAAATTAHAIDVEDSSYLTLENFRVAGLVASDAVMIDNSQNITLNDVMDWVGYIPNGQSAPDVHVTGDSTGISVTRGSFFNDYGQPYIEVDAGGSDDVISDNAFWADSVATVVVSGTPGAEITGNSFQIGRSTAIAITGQSPNSVVEDNAIGYLSYAFPGTGGESIEVGAGSTSGTTLDYNIAEALVNGAYAWGGATYASASALHTATGQGAHDINASPDTYVGGDALMLSYNSPAIDSADAGAPGEQSTDIQGQSCIDDPSYPVTGAGTPGYCSRGSYQYQDPLTALMTATETASMSARVDATQSHGAQGISSYSFDFGDGSVPVVNTTGTATHTYAHSGSYPVTVTVTDSTGATNTSTAVDVTTVGSDFTAISPIRMLDTRDGNGIPGGPEKLSNGTTLVVRLPAAVQAEGKLLQAVALNLTVTDATGNGYVGVSAYTSSVNYAAGQTIAGMAIAPVVYDSGVLYAQLSVTGAGSIDLIADMTGYFSTDSTAGYQAIAPYRLLDTRDGTGGSSGKLTSARPDAVTVAGADDSVIPSSGVSAVAVNITVADATGGGFITAYPDGTTNPGTSNINFGKNQILANFAIVPVGSDGKMDLADPAPGSTDVVVDVVGYFSNDATSAYVQVGPFRVIDTRNGDAAFGCNTAQGALAHDAVLTTALSCPSGGFTASAYGDVTAVALNDTVTQNTAPGYLTTYPAGGALPTASDLDWQHGGQTIANLTFAATGTSNEVSFANESAGSTQLVVDVYGLFTNN
jgi:hypothetical protein